MYFSPLRKTDQIVMIFIQKMDYPWNFNDKYMNPRIMLKLLAMWPNSGQCVGLPDAEKHALFHETTIGLWLF